MKPGSLITRYGRMALHQSGALRLVRKACERNFRILMYHNFPPDLTGLRNHCEHIRRYFNPVSMSVIAQSLTTGRPLPNNAVAITVDDGYRDFLLYAHPCFKEYDIPTTVFLVSDFLDGKLWLWWNQIEYAIRQSPQPQITVDLSGNKRIFPLQTSEGKGHAFDQLTEALKSLPDPELRIAVRAIIDASGVPMPAHIPEEWKPMEWKEVRRLSEENVEFGGHTRTHPILSKVASLPALRDEIEGCKLRIEEELGHPVTHFCYPNGGPQDIGADAIRLTKESGYQTAVTTEWGMNRLDSADPFSLRRLPVTPEVSPEKFAELLAGSPFAAIRKFVGMQKPI